VVEIVCPHCEEDIVLEDGDFGTFECPYCNGEFDWNEEETEDFNIPDGYISEGKSRNWIIKSIKNLMSGSFLLSGVVMVIVAFLVATSSGSFIMDWNGEGTSEFAGVGGIIVWGLAAIVFLISLSVGFLGLLVIITGLTALLRK